MASDPLTALANCGEVKGPTRKTDVWATRPARGPQCPPAEPLDSQTSPFARGLYKPQHVLAEPNEVFPAYRILRKNQVLDERVIFSEEVRNEKVLFFLHPEIYAVTFRFVFLI